MTERTQRGVWIGHAALIPAPSGGQPEVHVEILNRTGAVADGTLTVSRMAGRQSPALTFGFHLPGNRTIAILWRSDDPGNPSTGSVIQPGAPLRIVLSADADGRAYHDEFVIYPPGHVANLPRRSPVFRSHRDAGEFSRAGRFSLLAGAH